MSTRKRHLTKTEITKAFTEGAGAQIPVILTTAMLAALVHVKPKTIYDWIARGCLDGAFRRRGKLHLFWRDRVTELIFNGPEWKNAREKENE